MRVTATAASRGFSELLSRVSSGETVEVERHGAIVAVLRPPRRDDISADMLRHLLRRLPRPDPGFAADVAALAAVTRAPADAWPS